MKIGQSSHKIYSHNTLNFQGPTPILNAHTTKSGNLSYTPRNVVINTPTIISMAENPTQQNLLRFDSINFIMHKIKVKMLTE